MSQHVQRLLTPAESSRLDSLESVISEGKQAFIEVGLALAEIRDARLYRTAHKTFEDYCREKWSFTKTYANNLIEGAAVVMELPKEMTTMVVNERQVRELAKVEPDKRVEVLERAASKGPVTAKAINKAAEEIAPKTNDQQFVEALGGARSIQQFEATEPRVTEYYVRLESLVNDALENATDKQLQSMSVYAKLIPKKIKEALGSRKAAA